MVADPRKTWLAERADVWLNLNVGSNIALLNGMVRVILENGWEKGVRSDPQQQTWAEIGRDAG